MNEKENIENMTPDLPESDAEGFDNAEEITSVDREKTYVPYEEEAPYEASPENVMNLGHIGSLDELDESMAGEEEEEEDDDDKKPFISARMIKIGALMMLTTVVFILGIIAWFSMSKNVGTGGMGLTSHTSGFELSVSGSGSIGFNDLYQYLDNEYTGNSGTITNTSERGQVISWRMDSGDEELQPGSQGELHFSVISTGADLNSLKYKIHVSAYDAITHDVTTTDEQGNTIESQVIDNLVPITVSEGYSGSVLESADFINNHVMFFTGRHGTSKDNYEYYGFISNKDDFELTLVNGSGTIYWIWPNTLGQITLESIDTAYINGSPLLYKPSEGDTETYDEDRTKMTNYLKTHQSSIFSGTENYSSLIDTMYANRTSGESYRTQFDKLSDGYNTADQTIGKNVDYVLVEMIVTSY